MSMEKEKKHPSVFEPFAIVLNLAVSVVGAIIGIQIVTTLGVTPSTSIIGALVAMLIARIPMELFRKYKSIHRQNLMQTSISSATFGAANSLLIPIGIPFIMGKTELILPMLIGAALAMFIDATLLYKLFDSRIFPARESWAPGVATAESILAGDKGGKRAGLLGIGALIGVIGSVLKIPMSALGVAFIGNIWALTMFGVGLLINQYSMPLFQLDVGKLYIAHGIMIGAGIVALIQVAVLIFKREDSAAEASKENEAVTVPMRSVKRTLGLGYVAYLAVAVIIAVLGGLMTKMSAGMLIGFIIFAAFAAFFHELIVGIAAMHSGWFPAFADMGYDLKTGYILRGNGSDKELEIRGRKQQYYTGMIAFGVALLTVVLTYKGFFGQNLVPPIDKVYASTINAGASLDVAMKLLIWAIPGAIIQWIGGPNRQLGVMLATGLLIVSPNACWAVLGGILIRVAVLKIKGKKAESTMSILAAGFIAGDALYSFFTSVFKASK
ncbi:OPT/YSL family transporter [Paenibacillus larvae subsp. larvae]|uniref:OPT/YSL family transporter n=1 Tax=Paenibacillus larvae TaxID=1464 RepID=UPI0023A9B220|nr:OPT/YSL family transporter [Paenibacillus larvae]MDE5161329.1 OPT/YSL family transporter [Paenibacillus larvae subsp. larvae]